MREPTLFTNAFGPPGTGKTRLGFTHPPPFHYARFDRRADDLIAQVEKALGAGVVMEQSYIPVLLEDLKPAYTVFLRRFEQQAKAALQMGEGTFFIDGGHRLWDIVQSEKLPSLEGLDDDERERMERKRRLLFGGANSYLNDILLALEDSPLHVYITHHTKAVYDSFGKETDRVRPDYFKRVPYSATVEIFTLADRPTDVHLPSVQALAKSGNGVVPVLRGPPTFWGLVAVCKFDASIEGKLFPNLTFPYLYGMALSRPWKGRECWAPSP